MTYITEKIRQRRSQMLIHSCIYYHLNDSIVTDNKWQEWANELRDLQELFSESIGFYDREFKDWDGSTGYHLPIRHPEIMGMANRVLNYHYRLSAKNLTY